jgi:hypothetical protein
MTIFFTSQKHPYNSKIECFFLIIFHESLQNVSVLVAKGNWPVEVLKTFLVYRLSPEYNLLPTGNDQFEAQK